MGRQPVMRQFIQLLFREWLPACTAFCHRIVHFIDVTACQTMCFPEPSLTIQQDGDVDNECREDGCGQRCEDDGSPWIFVEPSTAVVRRVRFFELRRGGLQEISAGRLTVQRPCITSCRSRSRHFITMLSRSVGTSRFSLCGMGWCCVPDLKSNFVFRLTVEWKLPPSGAETE